MSKSPFSIFDLCFILFRRKWLSLQDYIDVQRYNRRLAETAQKLTLEELQAQLRDCVFFDRF